MAAGSNYVAAAWDITGEGHHSTPTLLCWWQDKCSSCPISLLAPLIPLASSQLANYWRIILQVSYWHVLCSWQEVLQRSLLR